MEIREVKLNKQVFEELVENKRTFDIVQGNDFSVGEYLHYSLTDGEEELKARARDLFFKITYVTENGGFSILQLKKVMFEEKGVK